MLLSGKETDMLEALKGLRNEGTADTLLVMAAILKTGCSFSVAESIDKMLMELKIKDAVPTLINLLENKDYTEQHELFARALWSSGLPVGEYLPRLTEVMVHADYLTAFECLTVLENLIEIPEEEFLNESQLVFGTYLQSNEVAQETKHIITLGLQCVTDMVRNS
jgi:hypothetical protein